MEVSPATGPLLEQILDASHDLWSEGLTRAGYARYNAAQLQTVWGRTHLQRLALVEHGRVLATAKRYDLAARVDGVRRRVLGIGAVFTPPELRRRGFARQLIERMMAAAARDGVTAALLFSEIGPDYYVRLGFSIVPIDAIDLELRPSRGTPAVPLRTGDDRDVPRLAEIAARMTEPARFALERPAEFIQYGLTKKRLLAGFTPHGRRRVEFFVVEEGGQPAAYVIITATPRGRVLEECGDRDSRGARVGAMLQALLAQGGTGSTERVTAWLPPGFLPPQLSIVTRAPARDVMMTRGIDPPPSAAAVSYWHGDIF